MVRPRASISVAPRIPNHNCATKVYDYYHFLHPPLREAPSTRFPRHEVFSYQRTALAHSIRCRAVYHTSNIHSRAENFILSRKNQVFGITVKYTRGCHLASRFSHTATCPVFESKLKIARDTCSPRPGTEILLQFLGVLWSPNGQVNDKRHDSPHRRAAQFECNSSRGFVTRGS
jgi:hypothetical protein